MAVQAQDLAFARLAFRPRCRAGLAAADVDAALRERALVWTWTLRGTLHLVRSSDARWLLALLGPIFVARGRRRRLALGLTDDLCERALAPLRDVLAAEGPQTRGALVARLPIDARGQAGAHLLAYAAMRGVICRRPLEGREPTYMLLDEWLGPFDGGAAPDEETALARLALRYLAGHGPATAQDLAAWAGIGMVRARRGLAAAGADVGQDAAGRFVLSALRARMGERAPRAALLGHFDPLLLGYASRDLVLDPRHAKRIQSGGGFVGPAVLVDGRVAGTWRRGARNSLELFAPVGDDIRGALEREREDVERFLAAAA